MLFRAIGTGYGQRVYSFRESLEYELGKVDEQVSMAYFPSNVKTAQDLWVGNADVALVADESACIVVRRFCGDAGTSPSPIGRISRNKPDWKPHTSTWTASYDEWIVVPVRYTHFVFLNHFSRENEKARIRADMAEHGLIELKRRRRGHQK